ncbi:hypothetical protein MN116_006196, partial [Schistosoma mekongi]
ATLNILTISYYFWIKSASIIIRSTCVHGFQFTLLLGLLNPDEFSDTGHHLTLIF